MKWALAASALALVVVPVSHTAAPASGTIVFSSTRAAYFHDEVVVLDPVTGARRNLSDSPSSDRDPAVSPDGRRVAFVTDRGGGEAVWVVGVDGSGLRRVTAEYADGPGAASVLSRPTWRADGRWLAYVVEQFRVAGSSTQVLYVVPSEGGPSRALARGVSVWGEWAATGERLAVGHYDPSAKEFVVSVMTAGGKLVWRRPGLGAVWSARGELAVTERGRVSVYSSSGGLRARRPGRNVAWQPSGELLAIVRRSGIWVLDGSGGQRRITGSASTFDSPAWSSDGRRLLYRDAQYRSSVASVDGRPPVRLRPDVHGYRWLADGRLLVFVVDGGGGVGGLAVLRSPADRPRVTTRLPRDVSPCPSWTRVAASLPDGRVVASVGQRGLGQADLWTIPVSGGAPSRLLGRPADWESSPTWSPGGESLVFQRGEILTNAGSCLGTMEPTLWIAGPDGSGARQLTRKPEIGGFGDWDPAWSPDGRRLAYRESEKGVYVVDAAGGSPALVAGGAAWPSWSPDGAELAVAAEDGVAIVASDGSARRRIAPGGMPAWSPDGSVVAFFDAGALWTVAPDGGRHRHLLALALGLEPSMGTLPYRWSPDGTRLAVVDDRGLHVVHREGGSRLIVGRRGVREVSWSPAGDRIAFTATVGRVGGGPSSGVERTELFVVGANGGAPTQLTHDLADISGPAWRPG